MKKRSDGRSIPRDALEHYRFQALELKRKKWKINNIAETFGVRREAVSRWISKAKKYGKDILKRKKAKGKEPKLNKEDKNKIISYLHIKPSKLGLHYNNWSWKKLAQFAKQNNIKISPSQIGRIIKKENIKYKTKRSKMYSTDKNFLKNIQE
jgi:transposase